MTSHDAYTDDPWNEPEVEWGPGHPNFIPGYDDMTTDEWISFVGGDDWEEPSGPTPEQEREWDLRDDEIRGNVLD